MSDVALRGQLSATLKRLPKAAQRKVLAYARQLEKAKSPGRSASSLLALAGSISKEDAELMRQAIEAGCEAVDAHGW